MVPSIGDTMREIITLALCMVLSPIFLKTVRAAELLMVEQLGCYYCLEWKDEIGPIYPKTPEGKFAPIRFIDITKIDEIKGLKRDVVFTPTFLLMENDKELARLEGYLSEDFFWGLLEVMLQKETNFKATDKTNRTNH